MLRRSEILLRRGFSAGVFSKSTFKQGQRNRAAINAGQVSTAEQGDPFSESRVYRNTTNATIAAKLPNKIRTTLQHQRLNHEFSLNNTSSSEQLALDRGDVHPSRDSEGQRRSSQLLNDKDLSPSADSSQLSSSHSTSSFSRQTRDALRSDQYRRENLALKYPQAPSGKVFHKMLSKMSHDEEEERKIDMIQRRLVEEHGIYPSHRIDAYMLDEESLFPAWVHQLPWSLRDRVKFGKMGITEEDEAMRVRLGRLPMDQRTREWQRLKKAKEYQAAQEEMLSPTELRDARRGARRFHALQRKRQHRAATLRQLALRKPDRFEAWPSDAVDYSRRLSIIAQHVENGVATHGKWPLDEEELAKAKIRRRQDDAERTFMKSAEERKMMNTQKMGGSVAETLRHMDKIRSDKPFKRLSRKKYANRVNAVKLGQQDEYGRRYHEIKGQIDKRRNGYESMAEVALAREVRKEPTPSSPSKRHSDSEHWGERFQETTYRSGIPSVRYGS